MPESYREMYKKPHLEWEICFLQVRLFSLVFVFQKQFLHKLSEEQHGKSTFWTFGKNEIFQKID